MARAQPVERAQPVAPRAAQLPVVVRQAVRVLLARSAPRELLPRLEVQVAQRVGLVQPVALPGVQVLRAEQAGRVAKVAPRLAGSAAAGSAAVLEAVSAAAERAQVLGKPRPLCKQSPRAREPESRR